MAASVRCFLITGAGGFIGRRTVAALLDRGDRVRALVRRTSALPPRPGLEAVAGDIRDLDRVLVAARGAQVAVHLAARKADEPDSRETNVGGAAHLIQACRREGVGQIVNVSTQATRIRPRGLYGETKAEADRLFAASGLEVVTLVPSLVYGNDTGGAFARLVEQVRRLPVFPLIGGGRAVFQPVHVDDLVRGILAAADREPPAGGEIEVGGPDAVTFAELVARVGRLAGRTPRTVRLPWWPCQLAVRLSCALLGRGPLTVSNVLALAPHNDRRLDLRALEQDLGVRPIGLDLGLARVFGTPTA